MKIKVKFPLIVSLALLCLISGCYFAFDNPDDEYEPHIRTAPGKITAENYSKFGRSITTDGDHVMVCNFDDIHIFKYNSSGIALIQTIDLDFNYSNFSMIVHRSKLILGHVDANGTGTVYVYSRNGDIWELSQEIRKGSGRNWFGWSIDIDDERMVVGANCFSSDCDTATTCQGMEITDRHAIIGGMNLEDYFRADMYISETCSPLIKDGIKLAAIVVHRM